MSEAIAIPAGSIILRELTLPPSFKTEKNNALSQSALIGKVKDEDGLALAVVASAELKRLRLFIDKSHKEVKEPALDVCRKIDATKKEALSEMTDEEIRVNNEIGNYQQAKIEAARELERERQRELDRIERERQAELAEIARKQREEEQARIQAEQEAKRQAEAAEAQRLAELRRIENERMAAKSKADKARLDAERIEVERKAQAAAEAARIETERLNLERAESARKAALDATVLQERSEQSVLAMGSAHVAATARGQSSKAVKDYRVINMPLLYKMHPGFCKPIEENRSEILHAINEAGVKQIHGLEIFDKVKTNINVNAAGRKAIEV